MITLTPCALNAEFQHFILRFNIKKFITLLIPLNEGIRGESRPKRHCEDRVTLCIHKVLDIGPFGIWALLFSLPASGQG